jgi:signal transduction histidine kinase
MNDEFLAVVSHELRTPLNAIMGWAHLLSGGALDEAGAEKALRIIERNAAMQARLIDDLLDVSKFSNGQPLEQTAPVNIVALVTTAVEAIAPAAAARRIAVTLTVQDGEPGVDGYGARLQQVVSNLLSNAVKFTPDDGSLQVSVSADVSQVHVAVRDSGRGIEALDLHRVFEPFWQVDTTLTRTDTGLGLGLAIVRSLVDAHGGTVTAESAGLGQDSCFTVSLPRREQARDRRRS